MNSLQELYLWVLCWHRWILGAGLLSRFEPDQADSVGQPAAGVLYFSAVAERVHTSDHIESGTSTQECVIPTSSRRVLQRRLSSCSCLIRLFALLSESESLLDFFNGFRVARTRCSPAAGFRRSSTNCMPTQKNEEARRDGRKKEKANATLAGCVRFRFCRSLARHSRVRQTP